MNNQIRFPYSNEIDFSTEVGNTGQDHDNYATPGSLPRYDWIRSIMLGLLACQASNKEPNEHRPGTLWFNLKDFFYKCSQGNAFEDLTHSIMLSSMNLYEWGLDMEEKRRMFQPTCCFSGATHVTTDVINIPSQVQYMAVAPNRPFLFKNGKIVDPNLVKFNDGCPVAVELSGNAILSPDDEFTVFIRQ